MMQSSKRKPSLPSTRALSNRILAVIDRVMDEDEDWCRDNVADAIAVELDAAIPVARAEDELLATQVEAWACQRDAEHMSEPHDDMKQARTAALHRAASRLRALAAAGAEPTREQIMQRVYEADVPPGWIEDGGTSWATFKECFGPPRQLTGVSGEQYRRIERVADLFMALFRAKEPS